MKWNSSKQNFFSLSVIFCLILIVATGCKEDTAQNESDNIGTIVGVFELSYGNPKIILDGDKELAVSLTSVRDSVMVNCALVDFAEPNAALDVRVYAYLEMNNQNEDVEIASKPCGALYYANDGQDLEDVLTYINEIESDPANQGNSSYYSDTFMNSFGEGSFIDDSQYRIFMAKASPLYYDQPNATLGDYRFVFILTRVPE